MTKIVTKPALLTLGLVIWLGTAFDRTVGASTFSEPPASLAAQAIPEHPKLVARVSRWQGDSVKKTKGPAGFDLQFRLVSLRFDGTFGLEGLPQGVPEAEAFDAQIKLTNIGTKAIPVASVSVTGDGLSLTTELLAKKVGPKSAAVVAAFKVPAQSSAGSKFLITVLLGNGDKHQATLTFSPPASSPSKP